MRSLCTTPSGPVITERPLPTPPTGWVRLRVGMAGVCRTDIAAAEGRIAVPTGRILGHELAGWTDDGRLVSVRPRLNDGRFVGLELDGAFAEHMVVPRASLVALPSDMDLRRGAFVEPMAAALSVLDVLPADGRVFVRGTGRIADLCRRVLAWAGQALVADEEDLDVLVTTGVDHTQSLAAVRRGGLVVLKGRPAGPVLLDQRTVVENSLRLRGVDYGDFEHAAQLLAEGTIVVDDLFAEACSLDEFAAVFSAGHDRKTFLRPTP